jgi:hypothetical protein
MAPRPLVWVDDYGSSYDDYEVIVRAVLPLSTPPSGCDIAERFSQALPVPSQMPTALLSLLPRLGSLAVFTEGAPAVEEGGAVSAQACVAALDEALARAQDEDGWVDNQSDHRHHRHFHH